MQLGIKALDIDNQRSNEQEKTNNNEIVPMKTMKVDIKKATKQTEKEKPGMVDNYV